VPAIGSQAADESWGQTHSSELC